MAFSVLRLLSKSGMAKRSGMEAPVLEELGDGENLSRVGPEGEPSECDDVGDDLDELARRDDSPRQIGEPRRTELVDLDEEEEADERAEGDVRLKRGEKGGGLEDELDEDEGKNVGVLPEVGGRKKLGVLSEGVLTVGEFLVRPRAASCHCRTGTDFSEGEQFNRCSKPGIKEPKRGDAK